MHERTSREHEFKEESKNMDTRLNIDAFKCTLTGKLFTDPVIAADGYTYEKAAILEWLKKQDTSPTTGQKLISRALIMNWTLKQAMKEIIPKLQSQALELEKNKIAFFNNAHSFWDFCYSDRKNGTKKEIDESSSALEDKKQTQNESAKLKEENPHGFWDFSWFNTKKTDEKTNNRSCFSLLGFST